MVERCSQSAWDERGAALGGGEEKVWLGECYFPSIKKQSSLPHIWVIHFKRIVLKGYKRIMETSLSHTPIGMDIVCASSIAFIMTYKSCIIMTSYISWLQLELNC